MKKCDLRTGMVVEVANGEKYLVVEDRFVSRDGFNNLNSYNEHLNCIGNSRYNITKVFRVALSKVRNIYEIFEDDYLVKLWDRVPSSVELTLEDIAKKFNVDVSQIKIKK